MPQDSGIIGDEQKDEGVRAGREMLRLSLIAALHMEYMVMVPM